jgi:hypothetical protein
MPRFSVIVGNIGQAFAGDDYAQACRVYEEYVSQSEYSTGRAAGEDITLFDNVHGEPVLEYEGYLSRQGE